MRVSVEGQLLDVDNATGNITTDSDPVYVKHRVLLVTYKRR